MTNQAMGVARTKANNTSIRKSLESSPTMLLILAPNTLRIPISLILWAAAWVARPNSPKQEISMADKPKA